MQMRLHILRPKLRVDHPVFKKLASLGVTVSVIEDSDYEGAYRQIAEELRKRWKS